MRKGWHPNATGAQPCDGNPDDILKGAEANRWGKNFLKKIRKHIDQIRNRNKATGGPKDPIPDIANGGADRVKGIINARVAQGGGEWINFAGESAIKYVDNGVTYIFHPNGEFWTVLAN